MAKITSKNPRKHLNHWAQVHPQYTLIEEFLTWAHDRYRLDFDFEHARYGTPLDVCKILDKFFKVDRKQLEEERRALLDQQRALTGS